MATSVPTNLAYADWIKVTSADISDPANDPVKMVARIMVAMTEKIGDLLRLVAQKVSDLTAQVADVNGMLNVVNKAVQSVKPDADGDSVLTLYANTDKATAQKQYELFKAAGGDTVEFFQAGDGNWTVYVRKKNGSALTTALTNAASDTTTTNQQEQLSLQTLIGRFNSLIEAASSAIKNVTTQAQGVTQNYRA